MNTNSTKETRQSLGHNEAAEPGGSGGGAAPVDGEITEKNAASSLPAAPPPPAVVSTTPTKRTRPRFGQPRTRLALPQRAGFQRRWINDDPGRIAFAMECGWTHVKEGNKNRKTTVGTDAAGGALLGYAMEIPQELFDEDQQAKQVVNDEIDAAILQSAHRAQQGDGRYAPIDQATQRPLTEMTSGQASLTRG